MSKMKWFISLVLSLGLLAGCEETAVKPEKKAEPKQEEQKEVAKQEEQKDVPKPEEKQQEEQKDKQEQKVEEKQKEEKAQAQPEVKKEEQPKEQPAANKQPEQQKVQEEKPQPQKAPEEKEEAKVVNQPKETPKQEQKEDPNKGQKVTVPAPPTPVPDPVPPVPDPIIPKPKQVTISVKGHEGYILGAKKVDVQEGDTVYSVLKSTGLELDVMGSKGDIYVKGINDLYEKDITETSGWKYRVNGAFPNYSAGVVKVKPGDTIEWVFVLK
ncbi:MULTISPECIES: DUF4430 domain-containing protein [Bacillus cereus group]|uniref:Transcobalamin-like C-terminal domain-containing protein n=1 Tax=Bacillus cereus TaxID=1396 RepID=A0A2A8U251_BACCE|nr:DUF4430 domain-containing protein [Bacillus cereus]PDY75774.1 hypothetical protein CON06_29605 [Bacillus cereus]PFA12659.1 hypothetical protein CN382_15080 [Bacillus cereus]PFM39952.1 hypothetical protein COJ43_14170 [Bacillus cereus]PGL56748.1 hypothetical protein CN927_27540 [Bacillus cereus]PGQ07881.1 hypothetical protein COA08_17290 [Bacillus cereus]